MELPSSPRGNDGLQPGLSQDRDIVLIDSLNLVYQQGLLTLSSLTLLGHRRKDLSFLPATAEECKAFWEIHKKGVLVWKLFLTNTNETEKASSSEVARGYIDLGFLNKAFSTLLHINFISKDLRKKIIIWVRGWIFFRRWIAKNSIPRFTLCLSTPSNKSQRVDQDLYWSSPSSFFRLCCLLQLTWEWVVKVRNFWHVCLQDQWCVSSGPT